jgi:hypothetical protein
MTRPVRVSGSREFARFYSSLQNISLKENIENAMDALKENPSAGDRIRNNLWPKKYIKNYLINNLLVYKLGSDWRMLYTITVDKEQTACVILEVLDHKNYDNLFGYKTS